MKMKLLLLALAALAAINSYGQNRGVAYVDTLAVLDAMRPQPGMTVYVRGDTVTNDWGDTPLPFSYVSGSTNTITRFCRATATGVGRWAHDWDGDVRAFGAFPQFISLASIFPTNGTDCLGPIQSAIDYASSKGGGVVKLSAGTYWISDSLNMKPNVTLRGVASPNGFSAPRRTDRGFTGRIVGNTYIEMANADKIGKACVVFNGPTYYTNQFTESYVNLDGDTVFYRSGANTIENITFSVYQWGWGSTARYPVAGVVIHDVDGVRIRNCGFANIAGFGVWAHGARGLVVSDSTFANCLTAGTFLAFTSDTRYIGNVLGGSQMQFYCSNTEIIQNNEIWNPLNSLVSWGGTTNRAEWGITRPYNYYNTHRSEAVSDYFINDTGSWGADTGTMVVFRGSSPPSPFEIGKPYFAINGTNGALIKLAESPFDAMEGTAIDILSSSTNGTWNLTGYDNALTLYRCEEAIIQNNRLDQSYQDAISLERCIRADIVGNSIWEIGANMQPQRLFRVTDDSGFDGVSVKDSTAVGIKGNLLTGGYQFGSNSSNLFGVFRGAYVTNSFGVGFSGNTLANLNAGIYSDTGTRGGFEAASINMGGVGRISDSVNTNSPNSLIWTGLKVGGSNAVVSTAIPSGYTNLGDFTIRMTFPVGSPQVSFAGDSYEPLLVLGSTTNYSGGSVTTENSFRMTLYKASGSTNWSLLVDIVGTNSSYRRATISTVGEQYGKSGLFDIAITRTNGVWQLIRNGIFGTMTMLATGATPPNQTNSIHALHAILGTWPNNLWRNGWFYEVGLKNVSHSYTDLRDSRDRIPGTNQVFLWDFRGDTGSTVRDKSGNGVNATITSLDGVATHSFGFDVP